MHGESVSGKVSAFLKSIVFAVFALVSLGHRTAVAQIGVVDFQTVILNSAIDSGEDSLWDSTGKLCPPTLPFWHDHFVRNGSHEASCTIGDYRPEIERGPEYRIHYGNFRMLPGARESKIIPPSEFWICRKGVYSGLIFVVSEGYPLLMQAEDLYVARNYVAEPDNKWANHELPESPLQRVRREMVYACHGQTNVMVEPCCITKCQQ